MGTCDGCRHWLRPEERTDFYDAVTFADYRMNSDEVERTYGICRAVVQGWDLPSGPTPVAVVRDGSDYRASLFTKPEFGCVLFSGASGREES